MASMSRLLGNTVGKPNSNRYGTSANFPLRYAPHDTAHLIDLMGGNVGPGKVTFALCTYPSDLPSGNLPEQT